MTKALWVSDKAHVYIKSIAKMRNKTQAVVVDEMISTIQNFFKAELREQTKTKERE